MFCRDDDNDKSDDEDERIDFSANKEAIERQKVKESFLRAEHGNFTVTYHILCKHKQCHINTSEVFVPPFRRKCYT